MTHTLHYPAIVSLEGNMKHIDQRLHTLRQETKELAEQCRQIGDDKTYQLLLEVYELMEITHDTFLGKALTNIDGNLIKGNQKH